MIKGSIQQEDITLVNICALNTGGPSHIKGDTDSNIVISDFNTTLTSMDR